MLLNKMPEEIQEIPCDMAERVQDIAEEIKADEQPEIEVTEPVKPKAKGRPRGSLNKGPSKLRAKRTRIKETPVEEDPLAVYEPSSPKRNLKMPTDPSSSDIAAAMLKPLQDQTYSRQARKQRLYQSWFQ